MKKQALITGATSGIGRATALRLAKAGYDILATGRRTERLAALQAEIEAEGGRCTVLAFDVRNEEEVRRHLEPIAQVDLLVNNAGLAAGLEHIDRGDTRDWDAMIDTNVKGLLYVTRVIAPKMVAAGRGHIVNLGSIAGTEPYENGAVYCASKHAVHAISQSMRADLLSSGIKVTEIRPGMVDWKRVFEDADWFHWTGITPAISQGAAEACLEAVREANRRGITVSCDLNYRKNLWKYGAKASEIMPALVEGCDLIMGNEEDAEKVFGIKPEGFDASATGGKVDSDSFEQVCRQLMARFPKAQKVALTLRGSVNANHNTWGGVLFDGERLYRSARYDITHIVDRVGGGDAFMGGLIYGLRTYVGDDQKDNTQCNRLDQDRQLHTFAFAQPCHQRKSRSNAQFSRFGIRISAVYRR